MMKLYQGRSIISINNHYQVQCYWFYVNRDIPVASYAELIKDYSPIEESIEAAERAVNGYFTEHEIKILKDYLKVKGIGLEVEEVKHLPVEPDYIGLADLPLGGGAGHIHLTEHEGYSLPFNVWGYYDLKDSQDLVQL